MLTRPANLDDRISQGKVEKKRLHKTINVVLNYIYTGCIIMQNAVMHVNDSMGRMTVSESPLTHYQCSRHTCSCTSIQKVSRFHVIHYNILPHNHLPGDIHQSRDMITDTQ